MKLTGNLKKEVDNISTKEGKKEAIKKAGMLLTDDELEKVSGGFDYVIICNNCGGDITSDPNIPDDARCHCHERTLYHW